jgi:hypothetical protein
MSDAAAPQKPLICHPPGHFYSPIVDPAELAARRDTIWPRAPEILGIDFRPSEHRRILTEVFPRFAADYRYPDHESETTSEDQFYTGNSQFSWLDSRALFVFLRELRPKRVIEVGSGFSSLLTADVNRRWFDGSIDVECIEPYPRPFLERGVPGLTRLTRERVENLDVDLFTKLEPNDILFIDSSHVAKTGSDVNFLYFEVLPRLRSGVRIHVHDIFLPADYPQSWVLHENRSWNEQYVLRALLMHSTAFRVMFACNYAFMRFPELVATAIGVEPGKGFGGGSCWIERG